MIQLEIDGGIPRKVLFMMSVVAGLTVANLYYSQPLLESIRIDVKASEMEVNLVTFVTQIGYALGLLFVVPLADMWSRRHIVAVSMGVAMLMSLMMAVGTSIYVLWTASLLLGLCSVVPQIFVPMARLYSLPLNKSRNMGFVLSGLLSGVLGARVLSGYVGDWCGWRMMYVVSAVTMLVCLFTTLRFLPRMQPTYQGSFGGLMRSIVTIYKRHPLIQMYSVRAAFTFGSMMCVWSCMAFHLAAAPFYAGSDAVGLLGMCGVAGAMSASGIGRFVTRFGIARISFLGNILQLLSWGVAWLMGHTYTGLILAIMLVDIGAQCNQLSNQSGCLAQVPEASNRANTIFMFHLFIGGSFGTLCAGLAWQLWGWGGVCMAGVVFAFVAFAITAISRK